MNSIFHLATRDEWDARTPERYVPAAFADDGFVHCSLADQVAATAERWFPRTDDLVLLEIDPAGLDVRSVDGFPHVHEPIPATAIVSVVPFRR